MTSTDNGIFGMNTPAYVCIDQVSTDNLLAASALRAERMNILIGPNPATDKIYLTLPVPGHLVVTSLDGRIQQAGHLPSGSLEWDVSDWPRGMYLLTFNGQVTGKIICD